MAQTAVASGAAETRQPDYDSDDKVLALVKRCVQDAQHNTARLDRDKQDLQNLFMYRGGVDNQWTVWDDQAQTYVPRPYTGEAGLPEYFPRCSSNIFAKKIDGVVSILNQSQPALESKPATDDDADLATADVVQHALPVLFDEVGYDTLRAQTHKLLALTNLVVHVVYFDNDEKYGMQDLPLYQCPACQKFAQPIDLQQSEGACPECGQDQQPLVNATHPATGVPIGLPAPIGKICAEKLHSFETSLPRSARTADELELPWVLTHRRYDKHDAIAKWKQLADRLSDGTSTTGGSGKLSSQTYADQAKNLSSPRTHQSSSGPGGMNTGPIIWRVWHDPIVDQEFNFPEGLYAVVYEDDLVLESAPLALKDDTGKSVKNLVIRTYAHSPGSAWGKPTADDLCPVQVMQNLALALAFLILMHDAAPTTFIPTTVTLLDDLSGQPGANVSYRSMNGEKPTRQPGQGFPDALKWFLEYLKQLFDDLSGLNAVLEGARPAGDPTLGEVQILQERGLAAFKEPIDNLVDGEKRFARLLLWTAKQSAWAPRFRQVQGENGEWEIKQFTAADLTGRVDIVCEPASAWPRSPLLQNIRLQNAIKAGILNPQDPEVQSQYLTLNDLTDFKKSIDADRKQVARQLDKWKHAQGPQDLEPPQPWWNLPVHLFLKTEFLKTEEYEQLRETNQPLAAAMVAHVEQLRTLMAPPAAPAAPVDAPAGAKGALAHAVATGALRPVGRPGGRAALAHAVTTGALHPVTAAPAAGVPA